MKIKSLFSQALAVVRYVQHRGVHAGSTFERINNVGKNLIGVAHGIVIGVVKLFFRATAQIVGRALRQPLLLILGAAQMIGRSVRPHHVKEEHLRLTF